MIPVLTSRPQWLLFDAVGTLILPEPRVAVAYHQIGTRYGSTRTVAEIDQRFREAYVRSDVVCFTADRIGRTSDAEEWARWRWIVQEVMGDLPQIEACFHDLWAHFADPQSWRVDLEAESTLARLSTMGYRLAVASNFDARLPPILAASPLHPYLERVLVSSTLGYRKPVAEFYRAALREIEAASEEVTMIGDDLAGDVQGPQAIGMHAIWLDRRRSKTAPASINRIETLSELLQLFTTEDQR
jgi:putative hydrolase of the HAD superfamily